MNEIQCKQINVTKYNLEIVTKCETQIDKSCNVTYIDVPTQECKPRRRNRWVQLQVSRGRDNVWCRCETLYKSVEDTEYREECAVDVQHLCEHHVEVEVPYDEETPYEEEVPYHKEQPAPIIGPQLPPDYAPPSDYSQSEYTPPSEYTPEYTSEYTLPQDYTPASDYSPPTAPVSLHGSYLPPSLYRAAVGDMAALKPADGDTTPTQMDDLQRQQQLTQEAPGHIHLAPPAPPPLPRQPVFLAAPPPAEVTARPPMMPYQYDPTPGPHLGTVSSIAPPLAYTLLHHLGKNTTARRARRSAMFRHGGGETAGAAPSEAQLRRIVRGILSSVLGHNQALGRVQATIRDSRSVAPVSFNLNMPQTNHLGGALVPDHSHLPPPHHPLPPPHPPPHPHPIPHHHHHAKEPVITTHELPAPEGCRSIATKECVKIPIIVPRKVTSCQAATAAAVPPSPCLDPVRGVRGRARRGVRQRAEEGAGAPVHARGLRGLQRSGEEGALPGAAGGLCRGHLR